MRPTEQQTLAFVTFCTEMYAAKKNVSGSEVAKLFCDSGVFDFLEENYIELHTLKEAYRTFFASEVYRQLETEATKRWWQSAEQIFEDGE